MTSQVRTTPTDKKLSDTHGSPRKATIRSETARTAESPSKQEAPEDEGSSEEAEDPKIDEKRWRESGKRRKKHVIHGRSEDTRQDARTPARILLNTRPFSRCVRLSSGAKGNDQTVSPSAGHQLSERITMNEEQCQTDNNTQDAS